MPERTWEKSLRKENQEPFETPRSFSPWFIIFTFFTRKNEVVQRIKVAKIVGKCKNAEGIHHIYFSHPTGCPEKKFLSFFHQQQKHKWLTLLTSKLQMSPPRWRTSRGQALSRSSRLPDYPFVQKHAGNWSNSWAHPLSRHEISVINVCLLCSVAHLETTLTLHTEHVGVGCDRDTYRFSLLVAVVMDMHIGSSGWKLWTG